MRRQSNLKSQTRLVEQWNAAYPPGTRVTLTLDDGTVMNTATRSDAWLVCGVAVVSVEGKSGGWALTRVQAEGNQTC